MSICCTGTMKPILSVCFGGAGVSLTRIIHETASDRR
jgi:hypothetical protein